MDWITPNFTPDLVSVIIPTHKRAEMLRETVSSMLSQSYRPLELVIVSDGTDASTDSSVSQSQKVAVEVGVGVVYEQQPESGAPAARNRGARKSTGEYLIFMDDDDLATADFLDSRMRVAKKTSAEMVFGPYTVFQQGPHGIHVVDVDWQKPSGSNGYNLHSFVKGWNLLLQGCLLRRDLVRRIGPWDESLSKAQDLDYKLRIAHSECRVAASESGIVYYRRHGQSITGRNTRDKTESVRAVLSKLVSLAQERDDFPQIQGDLANYAWSVGLSFVRRGNFNAAVDTLHQATELDASILARLPLLTRIIHAAGLIPIWVRVRHSLQRVKAMLRKVSARRTVRKLDLGPSSNAHETDTPFPDVQDDLRTKGGSCEE